MAGHLKIVRDAVKTNRVVRSVPQLLTFVVDPEVLHATALTHVLDPEPPLFPVPERVVQMAATADLEDADRSRLSRRSERADDRPHALLRLLQ